MNDDEQRKASVLAERLLSLTKLAEQNMTPDSIWTALLGTAVLYARRCGVPEERIRETLHESADNLEAQEQPAPSVN